MSRCGNAVPQVKKSSDHCPDNFHDSGVSMAKNTAASQPVLKFQSNKLLSDYPFSACDGG